MKISSEVTSTSNSLQYFGLMLLTLDHRSPQGMTVGIILSYPPALVTAASAAKLLEPPPLIVNSLTQIHVIIVWDYFLCLILVLSGELWGHTAFRWISPSSGENLLGGSSVPPNSVFSHSNCKTTLFLLSTNPGTITKGFCELESSGGGYNVKDWRFKGFHFFLAGDCIVFECSLESAFLPQGEREICPKAARGPRLVFILIA